MTVVEQHLASPGAFAAEHSDSERPLIVVVGVGPVGIHFAQRILNRNPTCPIILYGNEPWALYDRVRLISPPPACPCLKPPRSRKPPAGALQWT